MRTIRKFIKSLILGQVSFLRELIEKVNIIFDLKLPEIYNKINHLEERINNYEKEPYFRLKTLLKEVEPYQPLFGITVPNYQASRFTVDRATAIEKHLGNNLNGIRILDLGSSLGYLPLYFNSKGATATGWDYSEKNIHVSNLLKEINSSTSQFSHLELNLESCKSISSNKYDVVIILSLLHHIIHFQGLEACKTILNTILENIPQVYIEFATKDELVNLYWKEGLPSDILSLINNQKDYRIELVGEFPTHLSSIKRPLYSISKNTIRINNKLYPINEIKFKAYDEHPVKIPRVFYISDNHFIKYIPFDYIDKSISFKERVIKEIFIVSRLKNMIYFPNLVDFEVNSNGTYIIYERIEGKLLSELMLVLSNDTKIKIITDVIKIVKQLKDLNIYHNDLRLWNVMYNTNTKKTLIIDFETGSFKEEENNKVALENFIYDFMNNKLIIHNYPIIKSPQTSSILNMKEISDLLKEI